MKYVLVLTDEKPRRLQGRPPLAVRRTRGAGPNGRPVGGALLGDPNAPFAERLRQSIPIHRVDRRCSTGRVDRRPSQKSGSEKDGRRTNNGNEPADGRSPTSTRRADLHTAFRGTLPASSPRHTGFARPATNPKERTGGRTSQRCPFGRTGGPGPESRLGDRSTRFRMPCGSPPPGRRASTSTCFRNRRSGRPCRSQSCLTATPGASTA